MLFAGDILFCLDSRQNDYIFREFEVIGTGTDKGRLCVVLWDKSADRRTGLVVVAANSDGSITPRYDRSKKRLVDIEKAFHVVAIGQHEKELEKLDALLKDVT